MMKAGGTEIGKTLAEKSRGLFSANDWQCKTYVFIMNSKGQRAQRIKDHNFRWYHGVADQINFWITEKEKWVKVKLI